MVLEMVGTSNFKAMQWHKYLLRATFDTHFWPRFYIVILEIAFFLFTNFPYSIWTSYIPFLFGLLLPFFISLFYPDFSFSFLFSIFFNFFFQFFFQFFLFYCHFILDFFQIFSSQKSHSVWEATFMQKVGWIFAFRSAGPKIIYVLSMLKKEFDKWVHKRDMKRYIWQF